MTNTNIAEAEKLIANILKPVFSMHEAIAHDLITELDKHGLITADAKPDHTSKLPAPDRQGKWWPLTGPIGNIDTCNDTVMLHSQRFAGGVLTLDIHKARDLLLNLKPNVLSAIISIHSETLIQKLVSFAVVFLNLKRYNPTQEE